jgi:acetyltransferase-like isoleucine patch superfamily enzyme
VIGDGVVFYDGVTVNADSFTIGDFGTIGAFSFFPGPGKLIIGHNFWLGSGSIVDSQGSTTIGNNVGIGAGSQLWTHAAFGDVMAGCRFHGHKPLVIGDDVWLVGHCLVSPGSIGARALVLLGSVVTHDLEADHTYGGVPAVDVTEKLGPQFAPTAISEREAYLRRRLDEFARSYGVPNISAHVDVVRDWTQVDRKTESRTVICVGDRTYLKQRTRFERRLIRFLLPDAKFLPVG